MIKEAQKISRGGRPTKASAEQIEDKILDAATALFFKEGYGAVSIEAIAADAHISKRTFYTRYENKAAIFSAVVHRIIFRIRPAATATDQLFKGKTIEEVLKQIAPIILKASLSPETLALHRIVLAEAMRFPELALIMNEQSARQEAINRISQLLQHAESGHSKMTMDPVFAAEQFLLMLTAAPQRRALGLGIAMTASELESWIKNTIALFLSGIQK